MCTACRAGGSVHGCSCRRLEDRENDEYRSRIWMGLRASWQNLRVSYRRAGILQLCSSVERAPQVEVSKPDRIVQDKSSVLTNAGSFELGPHQNGAQEGREWALNSSSLTFARVTPLLYQINSIYYHYLQDYFCALFFLLHSVVAISIGDTKRPSTAISTDQVSNQLR
jgi:hypothetical protein